MNGGVGGGKWKVVEDDNFSYSGGPFFQNIPTVINPLGGPTMKRNDEVNNYLAFMYNIQASFLLF
jgi:hypothetical protein